MRETITFAEYMAWAESQNCSLSTGYVVGLDGRCHETLHIECESGTHCIKLGMGQYDDLTKEDVIKLDERLGLNSFFFDD